MEGFRVDWLPIPHCAHDGGLPLNDPNTEVLGFHLPALLVGYGELAEMLVRPGVVPVMVAAVVVDSWRRRSGGRGFPVMGSPWRFGWGLGWGNKWVSGGHSMQDDPKGITHWVVGTDSGWRGVCSEEVRDVKREG